MQKKFTLLVTLLLHAGALFAREQVAFITGGASGIGAATVKKFVDKNIKVGFLDINKTLGTELASAYSPEELLFIEGDVSKIADIQKAIAQTVEKFGRLDIIFANAGIYMQKNLLDSTEEDWDRLMNINLKGVVFTVKEGLPYLLKNGGGSVVLMGSDQCFIGKKNASFYGMSKGAIGQFTKSCAIDFGPQNIRINTVCPGTIQTPLVDALFSQAVAAAHGKIDKEDLWKQESEEYPLKKCGTPEEVANLVYFLASDEASFITGSLYLIDGGLTAY